MASFSGVWKVLPGKIDGSKIANFMIMLYHLCKCYILLYVSNITGCIFKSRIRIHRSCFFPWSQLLTDQRENLESPLLGVLLPLPSFIKLTSKNILSILFKKSQLY